MMTHVVTHLRSVEEAAVEQLQQLCYMVGPSIIKGLAEALAIEKRAVARQRFTQILLGFGAAGKTAVEQLRGSANPAVRRTAIHLLREFGGSEALPDLTTLLDDTEPHVQREAVRAILSIGTEEAYAELQRALATGIDSDARSADHGAGLHAKRARHSALRIHRPEDRSQGPAPLRLSAGRRIARRAEGRSIRSIC